MGYNTNQVVYSSGFSNGLIGTLVSKLNKFLFELEKNTSNPYFTYANKGEFARSIEYARKIENSLFGIDNSTKPFNFQRDLYLAAVAKTGKLLVIDPSFWSSPNSLFVRTSERQRKTTAVPKKPSRNIYKTS